MDYNYCFSSWKPQPHMADELELMRVHSFHGSVFEVGCNDGTFLKVLRDGGFPVLAGVEPNAFAREAATSAGLTIYGGLLGSEVCRQAVSERGQFEFVVARQVLEHITDLHGFFASARRLLRTDGMLLLELPNFEIALKAGDCSALWEEHVNYFSEPVLHRLLCRMGFEPIEARRYNFSGGGVAVLARQVEAQTEDAVSPALLDTALGFTREVESQGEALRASLASWKASGGRVVLYGTGCRACTLVNGLALSQHIDFAVDDQVERQGKYMPGSRLLVRSPRSLGESRDPTLCLLAVNQENDDKVKQRASGFGEAELAFLSPLAPNDFWGELGKLPRPPVLAGSR
jgi:SAM-dependent methyltransferase